MPRIIDPYDPRANADTFDWDGWKALVEKQRLEQVRRALQIVMTPNPLKE
jgi:hypothetical protein